MDTWQLLTQIKSNIFERWDSPSEGLKVCCIKFAQRVVAVQTSGAKDPRVRILRAYRHTTCVLTEELASKDDISLSMIIARHPLLNQYELSAEADALLDRLTSSLSDHPMYDVTACLHIANC